MPKWRMRWQSNTKFTLALWSYTLGLMNVWSVAKKITEFRLGLAALIPLTMIVVFIQIPCTFVELALGQYSKKTVLGAWDFCPLLRGVGIGSVVTFLLYQMYYGAICTYMLTYVIKAFTYQIPWISCHQNWITNNCITYRDNFSDFLTEDWKTSGEQFWRHHLLKEDPSGNLGYPNTELLCYSLITMMVVFLINFNGTRTVQAFLWVFLAVPTVQLVVILFATLLDYGGVKGFMNAVTLNSGSLSNAYAWKGLLEGSLQTGGLGLGAFITFGAHCDFRNPLYLKTISIAALNMLSTIVYSVVLENLLGIMSNQIGADVNTILRRNETLLTATVSQALTFMVKPVQFWTIMWYSNMYFIGLRSLTLMVCLNRDLFRIKLGKFRPVCPFLSSIMIFSSGSLFYTRSGFLILQTFERVLEQCLLPLLTLLQLTAVVFIYGIANFQNDLHFMLGIRPCGCLKLVLFLCPFIIASVLIYNVVEFFRSIDQNSVSWIFFLRLSLFWYIPLGVALTMLYYLVLKWNRRHLHVVRPTLNWSSMDPILRKSRRMFNKDMADEYIHRRGRLGAREAEETSL